MTAHRAPIDWRSTASPRVRPPLDGGSRPPKAAAASVPRRWAYRIGNTRNALRLEAVHRHEALLRLRVDVREHLDVRLEARASQLRLQQAVDLVDPGRVVHDDLDQDRARLAVADQDVLDRGRRQGVDRDGAALEGDARAALRHVERVRDAQDPRLE